MNFQYRSAEGSSVRLKAALGIGVFDGVHLGHRKILGELKSLAARHGALPLALTFDPHPRIILDCGEPPALLCSLADRIEMLKSGGAAAVEVMNFTPELASLPPDDFIRLLRSDDKVELCGICVGENWRFGAGGSGDAILLERLAREYGFEFVAVEQLRINGETVSSSAIRRAIASGLLDKASCMLGRFYSLKGRVECGHRVAGDGLGFPTANLAVSDGILPPDGVYAGCVRLAGVNHPAAVNIGLAPTFDWSERKRRVEVHVFDFSGDLYGRELEVALVEYLRPERAFAGAAELSAQIGRDVAKIRTIFNQR